MELFAACRCCVPLTLLPSTNTPYALCHQFAHSVVHDARRLCWRQPKRAEGFLPSSMRGHISAERDEKLPPARKRGLRGQQSKPCGRRSFGDTSSPMMHFRSGGTQAACLVGFLLVAFQLGGCAPLNYDRRLDAAQLRCEDLATRLQREGCRRKARSAKTYEEYLRNGGRPV